MSVTEVRAAERLAQTGAAEFLTGARV